MKKSISWCLAISILIAIPGLDFYSALAETIELSPGVSPAGKEFRPQIVSLPDSDFSALNPTAPKGPFSFSETASMLRSLWNRTNIFIRRPVDLQVNENLKKGPYSQEESPLSGSKTRQAPSANRIGESVVASEGEINVLQRGGLKRSTLDQFFDGWKWRKGSGGAVAVDSVKQSLQFDPKSVRVFLVRPGKPTTSTTLDSIGEILEKDPTLLNSFNRRNDVGWMGRIVLHVFKSKSAERFVSRVSEKFSAYPLRVILNKKNPYGGLTKDNSVEIARALQDHGINAKIQVENIPVDWQRYQERATAKSKVNVSSEKINNLEWNDPSAGNQHGLGWVFAPFREFIFIGRTLLASVTAPTKSELAGAAVTKIPGFVISVFVWIKAIGLAHPYLLAVALTLSFAWEAFHGVMLNTWNNFQNNLHKLRSGAYQTNFNWAYGMLYPAVFRIISHSANPADPDRSLPWSLKYWFSMTSPWTIAFWFALGPISVIGTFIGTLVYRGLNGLYENVRINRWQRSAIQQFRDLIMMGTGFLLGAGFKKYFVIIFLSQQIMDLVLYFLSLRVKSRPVLYFADDIIAGTKEFNDLYPVNSDGTVQSPLKQAMRAIKDIPLLFPVLLPVKYFFGLRNTQVLGLNISGSRGANK